MIQFRCADSGTVCPALLRASSKEDLERAVAEHFRRLHHVKTPTETLMSYLAALAKPVAGAAPAEEKAGAWPKGGG
jgi:predicted small metal-binding protein